MKPRIRVTSATGRLRPADSLFVFGSPSDAERGGVQGCLLGGFCKVEKRGNSCDLVATLLDVNWINLKDHVALRALDLRLEKKCVVHVMGCPVTHEVIFSRERPTRPERRGFAL